jgi:hypothetical protein
VETQGPRRPAAYRSGHVHWEPVHLLWWAILIGAPIVSGVALAGLVVAMLCTTKAPAEDDRGHRWSARLRPCPAAQVALRPGREYMKRYIRLGTVPPSPAPRRYLARRT